jgi:hypothetical protein
MPFLKRAIVSMDTDVTLSIQKQDNQMRKTNGKRFIQITETYYKQ